MERKRRGLTEGAGSPLLLAPTERERVALSFERKRRLHVAYRLYLVTAAIAVVLAICVLLVGFDGNRFRDVLSSVLGHDISPPTGDVGTPSERPEESETKKPEQSDQDRPSGKDETLEEDGDDLYDFDYSSVPNGSRPILPMDLSLLEYGATYVQNLTGLKPDLEALLRRSLSLSFTRPEPLSLRTADGPTVLILHTHATEAYSRDGATSCTEQESTARSDDPEQSVIAVGDALADALRKHGIQVLHDRTVHDAVQYRGAYDRAKETVEHYLEQYPSISLVIDLHRDAIEGSQGEVIRPVTLVDGEPTAQVMCVVGSDYGGESNPNWEGNLALALQLRERLNTEYKNLCRPPYLKASTYNQELARYSILLEIGSSGNSLAEAKRAAEAVAGELAELLGEMS